MKLNKLIAGDLLKIQAVFLYETVRLGQRNQEPDLL